MIKQLLNSVLAKYRDLSVARRSIICLYLRHRQIIDLLATDKSITIFSQPRPIIDKYYARADAAPLLSRMARKSCIFPHVILKYSKFANFTGLYFSFFTTFRSQSPNFAILITNFRIQYLKVL